MNTPELTQKRIQEYLSAGKRFDNRKLDEFREIKIETGISKNAEGSARVKLGDTEVLVGVKMSVGEPYPDSPDKGNLIVTSELLPLSSPRFESGPPRINTIELGRVIDRCVRESKFIEFEKLCIKEREKVWTVFIDIYSINDNGNLIDAAGIGAIAALKTAKIPIYDEKQEKIDYEKPAKKPLPLSKSVPFSITIHKVGKNLIVDPVLEEEDASEARVTIGIMDDSKELKISSVQKGNSKELDPEEVEKIFDLIEKIYKKTFPQIEKQVK